MSTRELLARTALFSGLDAKALDRLAGLCRRRSFRGGEPVFREGDPGTALYVVETGEVKILLSGAEGKEVVLVLLGPGEYFGELALLDGEPRSADAVTTAPAGLLILSREDFLRFLHETPAVAVSLLATLSRRLRRTDHLVHDAAFADVRTRLVKLLLELAQTRGQKSPEGVVIASRLTQGDLANMVGATRESVNKWLRYYAEQGLVRHEQRRLVLLNVERLRAEVA